ncbi:hypothetical protein WDU94_012753 [Cyamophila willieti]
MSGYTYCNEVSNHQNPRLNLFCWILIIDITLSIPKKNSSGSTCTMGISFKMKTHPPTYPNFSKRKT